MFVVTVITRSLMHFRTRSFRFVYKSDLQESIEDGKNDGVYISRSYDATSHFESVCADVKDIYKRVTGNDLVVQQRTRQEE